MCPDKKAEKWIRHVGMCLSCYIIALEHGADLELPLFDQKTRDMVAEFRQGDIAKSKRLTAHKVLDQIAKNLLETKEE